MTSLKVLSRRIYKSTVTDQVGVGPAKIGNSEI